jgi:hypothetical protein
VWEVSATSATPERGSVVGAEGSREVGHDPREATRLLWIEAALAAVAFAVLCLVVLSVPAQVAEPDDGAYHNSVVAITLGDFLTLSRPQLDAVAAKIGNRPGVPNQWVEVAGGRYISEKNAGYPYLAAPFEALGVIRWAPLFFGALACLALFVGARRWLGRFGGAVAVGLFCSSGAAIAFAWRDYMPTFTDASLIAAGSGLLLWAVLAVEASARRRLWMGLAGFVALELATFVRYTNIVILACGVVAALVAWRASRGRLPGRLVAWWIASVGVFGAIVAAFDSLAYGGPLATGYQYGHTTSGGEVSFSLGAILPNLQVMPAHLLEAMPMVIPALVAVVWIVLSALALRDRAGAAARRDAWVALGLAAAWFAIWGLYAAYDWTTDPTEVTVQAVRFYLPAIGPISLLAAWLVTRVRGSIWLTGMLSAVAIAVLFALGVASFYAMYAAFGVPLNG